jgi:hypothetical protein
MQWLARVQAAFDVGRSSFEREFGGWHI